MTPEARAGALPGGRTGRQVHSGSSLTRRVTLTFPRRLAGDHLNPTPARTSGAGTKLLVWSASEEKPPEPLRQPPRFGLGGEGGGERQKIVRPVKTALRLATVEMMDRWPGVNKGCQGDDGDRYI